MGTMRVHLLYCKFANSMMSCLVTGVYIFWEIIFVFTASIFALYCLPFATLRFSGCNLVVRVQPARRLELHCAVRSSVKIVEFVVKLLWGTLYRLDGRKGAFFLVQGPVQGPREEVQGPCARATKRGARA